MVLFIPVLILELGCRPIFLALQRKQWIPFFLFDGGKTLIYSQLELYTFDEPAVRKYSMIGKQLEKDGIVIRERDLQIASIAMSNKLIVVTHNVKEFKRIANLEVDDWAGDSI